MYTREEINEYVSVQSFSNHKTHKSGPVVIYWGNKAYKVTHIGVHHTIREGRVLCHIFSVTDGSMYFKLKYDTETLRWKLEEIATE